MIKISWEESHWAGCCEGCCMGNKYTHVFKITMGAFYSNHKIVIRLCKECLKELVRKTKTRRESKE
jgi:hypothetical protein